MADNSSNSKGHILVVDDEIAIRKIIAVSFKVLGFQVSEASDGKEGLEKARELLPDVIFSDWMMPVMDGLEFCKQLKADDRLKHIIFIMLTAKTELDDKVEGLDIGADDYLTKPFKAVEVEAKARAAMRIRNLQKEILDKNKELEELHKSKNDFLNMAAHDMRNPLNVIKLWSNSILEGAIGNIDANVEHGIKIILKRSVNMLDFVNDLLDIQKIEMGKLELKFEENNLYEDINILMDDNLILANDKKIKLSTSIDKKLAEIKFKYDRVRIMEVMTNLLSNALKYSSPGDSVVIEATINDGYHKVAIKDTGQGIHADDIKNLFGTFKKAKSVATGGEESTGLGLAICKKIVELHSGRIGVESDFGEGSTFWFELPLVNEDPESP